MKSTDRPREYIEKICEITNSNRKQSRENFGVSNVARIVEGGFLAGSPNFAKNPVGHAVIHSFVFLPPDVQVYFTLVVEDDIDKLVARLTEMRPLSGSPEDENAQIRADQDDDGQNTLDTKAPPDKKKETNNVRCYIPSGGVAPAGAFYLWETRRIDRAVPEDLLKTSPVAIDKVLFAVYPSRASTRRSLSAQLFLAYFADLVGREKLHEVDVWPDASTAHGVRRRMPTEVELPELKEGIKRLGGFYPGDEVERLHAGLNFLDHKHFVILSGLSGSGKTRLAVNYAQVVHGLESVGEPDPFLFVCSVRPEWSDPTGLTGYYDVLSERYIVPSFLEAVIFAGTYPDAAIFVLLDEMNLARVEYYFSDVLSCIESGQPLRLHTNDVPREGSTGDSIPREMRLSPNLYICGTVNIDETVTPISDKVLDRATVIDVSDVEISKFLDHLVGRDGRLRDARKECGQRLESVHALMAQHDLGFGYRVAEEVVRYHAFVGKTRPGVVDELMVQKVLVKLRGTEKQRALLTGLLGTLDGFEKSTKLLNRMLRDLEDFGSFQVGR